LSRIKYLNHFVQLFYHLLCYFLLLYCLLLYVNLFAAIALFSFYN
uniref:Ovule protein n=1 Tax=Brugia timori TaxID=42155 RepID=A0A0R3Q5U7_9BILA